MLSNLKDSRYALVTAIILGIAHMCMFVGFDTGSFIVESVLYSVHQRNPQDMNRHAGYYGQAIMYAFNMVGHIVAPAALCFMSAKWTMVLGSLFFTLSFGSYIFENEMIIYVSGALLGLFYAIYNAGYSRYLTQISTVHSIEKINGLEWSIACFGTLVGGLLIVPLIRMNPNSTKPSLYKEYTDTQVQCMFGAFTVIGLLANVIYCMLPTRKVKDCISSIAKDTEEKPKLNEIRDSIVDTAKAFFDPLVLQLSPHFFYVGVQCAVWLTIYPTTLQFTKHLSHSTYVITIYGCMFSIGEFAMGLLTVPLAKRINNFGQTPCLILSMVLQAICFILILISTANRSTSVPNNDPTLLIQPNKIIGLLQSLHDKVDAIPKCECSILRQEINEVKASLANTVQVLPSQPPPESTYAAVKQALTDATTYADKAKRAVWVGLQEGTTTEETTANDQKAIESLCSELNDPIISAALTEGSIKHHRHPEKKDRPVTAEKSRGGGVAILCSPLLHPILIQTYSCDGIESLVIDIHLPSLIPSHSLRSVRICLVYRSPSCSSPSLDSFLSFIQPLINDSPFIICGDLNFPSIDWSTLAFSKYFASVSTLPLHGPLPLPTSSPIIPLFDLPSISPEHVLSAIQSLVPKCNLSPDGLPNIFYYLGVIMQSSLKFTDHISKITCKARAKINLFVSSQQTLPYTVVLLLLLSDHFLSTVQSFGLLIRIGDLSLTFYSSTSPFMGSTVMTTPTFSVLLPLIVTFVEAILCVSHCHSFRLCLTQVFRLGVPMALIIGFLFGVLDSTNNTNRTVMCALAIPSKKAQVFAVARFYQALSAAIPLFLSAYLTTYRLLLIEFIICVVGAGLYLRVVHKIKHHTHEEPNSFEAFTRKESVAQ
uniref:Endonuclease/exonuclease/phosphatase domain-containing protein n=1 Tax=Pristionchus pacificus TaxID=54126 RepID=A0A8R1U4I7_PRIPA